MSALSERELILDRFIPASCLPHLSEYERQLYRVALIGEIYKFQLQQYPDNTKKQKQYQNSIDLVREIFPVKN